MLVYFWISITLNLVVLSCVFWLFRYLDIMDDRVKFFILNKMFRDK